MIILSEAGTGEPLEIATWKDYLISAPHQINHLQLGHNIRYQATRFHITRKINQIMIQKCWRYSTWLLCPQKEKTNTLLYIILDRNWAQQLHTRKIAVIGVFLVFPTHGILHLGFFYELCDGGEGILFYLVIGEWLKAECIYELWWLVQHFLHIFFIRTLSSDVVWRC